jgi:succinoglycan biosynthesis transport protein ExoP
MELRKYWEIICRRKWVLILSVILLPLFTYILFKIISPTYQSQAKLWVKVDTLQQKFIKDIPTEIGKFSFTDSDNAMGTIKEILVSEPVVGQVIREMNLRDKNGELFKVDDFANPNIFTLIFQKAGVGIDNISDSETFEITGYFGEPSKAKEISESVVRAFLDTFAKIYKKEAKEARKVIESRLMDVRERLKEAEQAVEDYRTQNKVYDIATQIKTLMAEISSLETERNTALHSLQENKLTLETIRESSLGKTEKFKEAIATIEDSTMVTTYKTQLLTLETNRAKLTTELTAEHPDVKIVNSQIDVVKDALKKEISKSFASRIVETDAFYNALVAKYSSALIDTVELRAREKILAEQLKEKQKRFDEIPGKEKRFNELSREVDNLKSVYNSLDSNMETTKSAEAMDLANAVVVQPPILHENVNQNLYFPPEKKKFTMVLATFIGMFFGIFLVFLLEYLDDSLWSPHEIEKSLNQKVIGVIPKVRRKDLDIGKIESSLLTDSIYNFLANIKLFKGNELGKIISIVSTIKQEGKSVLASFMAILLANQGKKVMLIDVNLRYPVLHNFFNLPNRIGLSNYLAEDIQIQEMISSTSIKNLHVITGGLALVVSPQKYFDSEKFSELLKTLTSYYDNIILDTPAFINGSDALIISRHAEDTILVVAQGKTPQKKAQSFMDTMNMTKFKFSGVVLNMVKYL